mmetsp:Transcript_65740/g.140629  ORF Transcript_65740/g.140629 Transcript_65740/m.140629 type:complete len:452 (-) Transcript_65740:104-1459(-)
MLAPPAVASTAAPSRPCVRPDEEEEQPLAPVVAAPPREQRPPRLPPPLKLPVSTAATAVACCPGSSERRSARGMSVAAAAAVLLTPRAASAASRAQTADAASGVALPVATIEPAVEALDAFQTWRLDLGLGGPAAVRVSEFADLRHVAPSPEARREAYGRPVNKRDLGHRCHHCRRPFSALGSPLVAECQGGVLGGPVQRCHPECWLKRNSGESTAVLTRVGSARSARSLDAAQAVDSEGDLVTAYTDEWRRASLDSGRPSTRSGRRAKAASPSLPPRPSVLEGMISTEDSHGERRVARGLSQREAEAVAAQWRCSVEALPDEECAICFTGSLTPQQQPLRLPCGHSFCSECVMPWLRRCALCPMCRRDLRPFLPPPGRPASASLKKPSSPPGRPASASLAKPLTPPLPSQASAACSSGSLSCSRGWSARSRCQEWGLQGRSLTRFPPLLP